MAHLSHAVREYRYGLMRDLMDREGYDAIAFTQGDFFQFGTNYHTNVQTWERPIVFVLPRQGEPFAVLNELSTHHWRFTKEAGRRFSGENFEVLRCWTLSGPASCAPHGDGRSAGARIEKGHGLVNIVIPRLNGIVIENERTWFCGEPSKRQVKLYDAARTANEAACAAAVTGAQVCGIDAAAQAVLGQHGVADLIMHRTGHGIGVLGHEFPEDMAFNTRPLMSNEIYSAEPGIYEWGLGGFRIDDTVLVGEQPEVLTKAARDLRAQTVL